jgi:phenylacetyl-CoA:acceptor oxidoreductase
VSGPDFLRVRVEDGVARCVEPNHEGADVHPALGRPCVKAYGLVQKTYNPHRILHADEAHQPEEGARRGSRLRADLLGRGARHRRRQAARTSRQRPHRRAGLPRVAASFGHGGTPASYMGTFPAFLSAWGPIDYSFGSGQGVKCTHSEHLYGEFWHRAFTVCRRHAQLPYMIAFGANVEVTGGVCAVKRHADARVRGMKRV